MYNTKFLASGNIDYLQFFLKQVSLVKFLMFVIPFIHHLWT